jgi:hypothetical protein
MRHLHVLLTTKFLGRLMIAFYFASAKLAPVPSSLDLQGKYIALIQEEMLQANIKTKARLMS